MDVDALLDVDVALDGEVAARFGDAQQGRALLAFALDVLEYAHDPAYRRTIHHLLSRGERRNSLARDVFHGRRGQLRRHYQVGQETSSAASAAWSTSSCQTVYTQAALDHLATNGYQSVGPSDNQFVIRIPPK